MQVVTLDMDAGKVLVNEESLGILEQRFRKLGVEKVAVVSVMGAFRTGKSFLLDLFLRFLRYEERCLARGEEPQRTVHPVRGSGQEMPIPKWMEDAGSTIEGASDADHGFRFKGGMDACTTGIWVWSEPFVRTVNGTRMAMLLMDTQGAWDSNMTKEQSATIFGLTAVLSSKQVYNINQQIQEDKVENLAYFMGFARAALKKAADEMKEQGTDTDLEAEIAQPFQSLDFLVRDWRNYKKDWPVEKCEEQMEEHLSRHVDPTKVRENSTAEALQSMFNRIKCFCLPHPGLIIEEEDWTGKVADISREFIRFVDLYVYQVFTEGLAPKKILGSEMSTITFPLVLRSFVEAFHKAAPVAMTFTQAMTSCTVLLAKEKALTTYTKKMEEALARAPGGMEPKNFEELQRTVSREIEADFKSITIFGSDSHRADTWKDIQDNLAGLHKRYVQDNDRRLEHALVAFGNITLVGAALFVLDRVSDWTCDWWSKTCVDVSKVMQVAYFIIFLYIGVQAYFIFKNRGRIAALMAGGELWKEVVRLLGVYAELIQSGDWKALTGKKD